MQVTRIFCALLAVGLAPALRAAPAAKPQELSLDECVQIALQHNLDVQIQRINPQIGRLTLSGAYGAYDPSFTAGYSHNYNLSTPSFSSVINANVPGSQTDGDNYSLGLGGLLPTGTSYSFNGTATDANGNSYYTTATNILGVPIAYAASGASVNLKQPLLKNFWTDGSRLNIQLSKRNLKITELTLRLQIMTTVTAVEQAYYELIAAQETVTAQQIGLDLAEQLLRENKRRVEVGTLAPLDEKQAESQAATSRAALIGARNAVVLRQNALKNLLSDKYRDWQDVDLEPGDKLSAAPPVLDRQDSWSKGLTLRPDLLQAKLSVEKNNITLRYDKNQLYPELDVVGSYGRNGSGGANGSLWGSLGGIRDADGETYSYGFTLTIPLSNRAAKSSYRTAKALVEQSLLQLKQLEQNIMVNIENDIAQARSSYEQVQATKEAVEFAIAALDAEKKKLDNGKSTSFQVLSLQSTLTTSRYNAIRALADYNEALSQLALAEGTTLDRNHINLEIK